MAEAEQMAVGGHKDLLKVLQEQKDRPTAFVFFSGSVDENGESWCSDCVKADPVVEQCLSAIPQDSVFILCDVGDRASWKDPENAFRVDPDLSLKCIPTLMKFENKGGKLTKTNSLSEGECAKADLIKMLFTDD